jgi:curli biogenesis system outer membrane secretion channel CsgG
MNRTLTFIAAAIALGALTSSAAQAAPPADPGTALAGLPPRPLDQRTAVAIYGFRSEVGEVGAGGATDMFVSALVKSHQFRVVDRSRVNDGVVQEKRLNGAGLTTGTTAQKQLRGAQYLFEGAVTEANAGEDAHQGGINIGGLQLGGSRGHDSIAVDVRILDAETGDVLDAVNVSVPIKSSSKAISGTAALADTIAGMSGSAASPLTPDVSAQSSHRDGVDAAVRTAIESAVLELAKRIDSSLATN